MSTLPIRPVFFALLRNGTGALLVAAQIAIALAVLVNAVYIVKQRVDKIGRPTGMDVENIFAVRSVGFAEGYQHEPTIREDLAYLRGLDGVIAATAMDYAPLSSRGNRVGVMLQPEDQAHAVGTNFYEIDEQGLQALGLKLISGRNFQPTEVLPPRVGDSASSSPAQVIVTQALANDLYPKGDALGKTLYDSFGFVAAPATIIGIVEHMHGGRVGWNRIDRVMLVPRIPYPEEPIAAYVVRTEPGRRDALIQAVEAHLTDSNPQRMIEDVRPLTYFKNLSYIADRNMGIFLVTVTAMLLAITSVGIFGLATFNVGTRTKQIGTRRAVGARRSDIVTYFLLENWLVTTVGIVLGCALALGSGHWLATKYQLPQLDLYYLVGGIPLLWIIGLLAAWQPARRASKVSPAVATRTV
jgi:putative ABC transport system permease protein